MYTQGQELQFAELRNDSMFEGNGWFVKRDHRGVLICMEDVTAPNGRFEWFRPDSVSPVKASPPVTWEYVTMTGSPASDDYESSLNAMGSEGWELVHVHDTPSWYISIFKRQIVAGL